MQSTDTFSFFSAIKKSAFKCLPFAAVGIMLSLPITGQTQATNPTSGPATTSPTTTGPATTTSATNASTPEHISALPLEDLRVFTKAYSLIRTSYIDEIDDRTLLEYAIKGMLDELDPHSSFLSEDSYDNLTKLTKGEFGGLGIEISTKDGYIKIISPIDDTPAQAAGIQAGDLIIKINGSPVKGDNLSEAVKKMRGEVGTDITLTISRSGIKEPFDVTITRDIIKVRSVRSDIVDQHFGYFRISQFQLKTGEDFKKEIKKIEAINPDLHGIILDLRNNPGGVLAASIDISDVFLNDGLIVYTQGRIQQANTEFFATKGEKFAGLPVVVLINGGSASASEIVAGALQDHKRAIILGTKSFGKGSVQKLIEITPKKAIKITTARYFTPSGKSIQAQGIVPDIIVAPANITLLKTREQVKESDLSGHLENNTPNELTIVHPENDKSLQRDNQLYEAVNILRGLHLYKTNLTNEPSTGNTAH